MSMIGRVEAIISDKLMATWSSASPMAEAYIRKLSGILAREVIEAMREPDDEFMEQIHLRSYDGRFCKSGETYPVYRNFLRSFVDAALKGGEAAR